MLFDAVAVTDAHVLEDVGVVPDFGNDGGGVGQLEVNYGSRIFRFAHVGHSEIGGDDLLLFELGDYWGGVLGCHPSFDAKFDDIRFVAEQLCTNGLGQCLLESLNLSWLHFLKTQEKLIAPDVLPLDVEICLARDLVVLPCNLQNLVDSKWVLTAKD